MLYYNKLNILYNLYYTSIIFHSKGLHINFAIIGAMISNGNDGIHAELSLCCKAISHL